MGRLRLERLTVGQHGLRHAREAMRRMVQFVADGGVWSDAALCGYATRCGLPKPSLICVSEFPAESGCAPLLLVHDGHHRLVATHLAGREFLDPEEYGVTRWSFEEYVAINLARGWVTPFDPRTHVRTADLTAWKEYILAMARSNPVEAERLIRERTNAYRELRRYARIAELVRDCCTLERHEQASQ